MTTTINPKSITVGPLPEVEPPPMVAGGQVWRNGFLVNGAHLTAAAGRTVPHETISAETFVAQRRQREDDILDAAARGDPALLFAVLTWVLRHNDAPSHADLAEWMEEGRQRMRDNVSGYALGQLAAHGPPPLAPVAAQTAKPPPKKKPRPWSEESRARARERGLKNWAARIAKRDAAETTEAAKAPQTDGGD